MLSSPLFVSAELSVGLVCIHFFQRDKRFFFCLSEYTTLFFCTNSVAVSKLDVIRKLNLI